MEVGKCVQQPTTGEGKWQNQAVPHQVYLLVLSKLQQTPQYKLKTEYVERGCEKQAIRQEE